MLHPVLLYAFILARENLYTIYFSIICTAHHNTRSTRGTNETKAVNERGKHVYKWKNHFYEMKGECRDVTS